MYAGHLLLSMAATGEASAACLKPFNTFLASSPTSLTLLLMHTAAVIPVAVAFGTFVWREVAMAYAKQQRALGRISSLSPSGVTNTAAPTEAAKAQSVPASPAGVNATAAQQKPAEGSTQAAATAGGIPVARIMQETAAPAAGHTATQGSVPAGTATSDPVNLASASSPKFLLPTSERPTGERLWAVCFHR